MNIDIPEITAARQNATDLAIGVYYVAGDGASGPVIVIQTAEGAPPLNYWMPVDWEFNQPIPAYRSGHEPVEQQIPPVASFIDAGTVERLLAVAIHSSAAEKLIK